MNVSSPSPGLPPIADIRQAAEIYIDQAYPDARPPEVQQFLPDADVDPATWLMSGLAERAPSDYDPLDQVRSFALRIGNRLYPNMKLRISRPPNSSCAVFHVDAHDAMLKAPAGSTDHVALQDIKAHNAELTARITAAWEAAGLLTERAYLRQEIARCRQNGDD